MRQRTVLRYYCDFCNKGGFRRAGMFTHERNCYRNPLRHCATCEAEGLSPAPMPDLIAALERGTGLEHVREAAQGCPTCILAAIVQFKDSERDTPDYDPTEPNWIDFDYKKELADYRFGLENPYRQRRLPVAVPDDMNPAF